MLQIMEDQTSDHVRYQVDTQPGQTLLTGNFADQAQLHGLLDQLRDLGIHLISVNPADQAWMPHS